MDSLITLVILQVFIHYLSSGGQEITHHLAHRRLDTLAESWRMSRPTMFEAVVTFGVRFETVANVGLGVA